MKYQNFPNEIEQVLKRIPKKQADYFREYFQSATAELISALPGSPRRGVQG